MECTFITISIEVCQPGRAKQMLLGPRFIIVYMALWHVTTARISRLIVNNEKEERKLAGEVFSCVETK